MNVTHNADGSLTIDVTAAEAVGVTALVDALDQLDADHVGAGAVDPATLARETADVAAASEALRDLSIDFPPAPATTTPGNVDVNPRPELAGQDASVPAYATEETAPAAPVVGETEPAATPDPAAELPGATTAPELTTAEVDATAATPVPAVLAADPAAESAPTPAE